MTRAQKSRKIAKRSTQGIPTATTARIPVSDPETWLKRLEFHREAIALMPDGADRHPGVAIVVLDEALGKQMRSCTCDRSGKRRTCPHLLALTEAIHQVRRHMQPPFSESALRASFWHRLAEFMAEGRCDEPANVQVIQVPGDASQVAVSAADGKRLLLYRSDRSDLSRFVERLTLLPPNSRVLTRGQVLQRLRSLTLTDHERAILEKGYRTRGLAFQESFWYQFAYHGFREWGPEGLSWRARIDSQSGNFYLAAENGQGDSICRIYIPRTRVKSLLKRLGPELATGGGLALAPVPLDVVFDARLREDSRLEIAPRLRLVQQAGEYRTLKNIDLKRFQYGDLVYIPELNLMADMVAPASTETLKPSSATLIEKAQIPFFLDEHREALQSGRIELTDANAGLKILTHYDRLRIAGGRLDRSGCQLAVWYGFGNAEVSLAEILEARRTGRRFVATDQGWVDTQDAVFDDTEALLPENGQSMARDSRWTASPADLLRIQAFSEVPVEVDGPEGADRWIARLLAGEPETPMPPIQSMASPLRDYQLRGVQWLWYLYQNGLGGLLCDEMGLGKTHQAMALMTLLADSDPRGGPFLVVCPTSVLHHWARKVAAHAPGLRLVLHYGQGRDLRQSLETADVLLTSYGVLLRDMPALGEEVFRMAICDEIQHIKNSQTKAYQAVEQIRAAVKIGLTGTPVENSLADLKSLIDLVVPGYLGTDERFRRRFVEPVESGRDPERRRQLQRLIHPFVLRRLKATVAEELPAKIEDTLGCRLSDDQVKLYRDALTARRTALLEALGDLEARVPYMHIFSLLNLLKQICNHPAMLEGAEDRPWASGKWDLFTELLDECLSGGQKVVVYSQYLRMIELIRKHLADRQVPAAVLTGASRERGRIVERFQNDPDCRVFVGSLKAGGVGIDLTAASVVIHYDRWWNAAREDQATDRIHRIGQRRGVQVFKLVTEGTLEEKIDAIIAKKKRLMESVVRPDDPDSLKIFTREELVALLEMPA